MRYSFTQPICNDDWEEQNPDRDPTRLTEPNEEVCCFCGALTKSGIYIRVDPTTVQHPTITK